MSAVSDKLQALGNHTKPYVADNSAFEQPTALHSSLAASVQQALTQAIRHSHTADQPSRPPLDHSLSVASLPAGPLSSCHQAMPLLQSQPGRLHGSQGQARQSLEPTLSMANLPAGLFDSYPQTVSSLRNQQGQLHGSDAAAPSLQLPAHVQQWLATLAQNARPGVLEGSSANEPIRAIADRLQRPSCEETSAGVQQDLKQLRDELADVKAKFADTQVCFARP